MAEDTLEFPGLCSHDEGGASDEEVHSPFELCDGRDEAGRADEIEERADHVDEEVEGKGEEPAVRVDVVEPLGDVRQQEGARTDGVEPA